MRISRTTMMERLGLSLLPHLLLLLSHSQLVSSAHTGWGISNHYNISPCMSETMGNFMNLTSFTLEHLIITPSYFKLPTISPSSTVLSFAPMKEGRSGLKGDDRERVGVEN